MSMLVQSAGVQPQSINTNQTITRIIKPAAATTTNIHQQQQQHSIVMQSRSVAATASNTTAAPTTAATTTTTTTTFVVTTPTYVTSSATSAATTIPAATNHSPIMAKVLTNASGQIISLESLMQKQGVSGGSMLRVQSGGGNASKSGQTRLIQLATSQPQQLAQYAVVSGPTGSLTGRNLISLAGATIQQQSGPQQQRLITSAANTVQISPTQFITTTRKNNSDISGLVQQQKLLPTAIGQVVQQQQMSQLVTSNPGQMINAKVLGVQSVSTRLKVAASNSPAAATAVTGGIRMVNASNLNIAHIAGKPVIIASKPMMQMQRQNIIWQQSAQQTSGQQQPTNFIIGGQTVKMLQTFDRTQQQSSSSVIGGGGGGGGAQTVMFGNQVVKLHASNQMNVRPQQPQQQNIVVSNARNVGNIGMATAGRTVVLGTTGQTIRVLSPAQSQQVVVSGSSAAGGGIVTLSSNQQKQQQHQIMLGQNIKVS